MQNRHFYYYLMSVEMDSVANIHSGVYLLHSIFFWMTCTISDNMWFFFCANISVLSIAFQRKSNRFFALSQVIFCLILIRFYQYKIEIFYLNNPQHILTNSTLKYAPCIHSVGKISNEQNNKKINRNSFFKSTRRFNEQKHLFISINM